MLQLYIRELKRVTNRGIPASPNRISHTCANCMIPACILLQNAELPGSTKNLILIGTVRSYLAVILPNMDLGTGGECG